MRLGHRRPSLQYLPLTYLLCFTTLPTTRFVWADSLAATNVSSEEWEKILKNDQGRDACTVRQWMMVDCPQGGGGDTTTRRGLHNRDDLNFTATNCTCTVPFFNIWCGCNLSIDHPIDSIYNTWNSQCEQRNSSVELNTMWIREVDTHIPLWAYTPLDNGTFNSVEIRSTVAKPPADWSIIQIVVPIIVGISVLLAAGLVFFCWRRYQLTKTKTTTGASFFGYVRKLLTSAPSIRNHDRNEGWEIDERQVNDNENDHDSLFMARHPPGFVESPVADAEVSHWSPTTPSAHSPPHFSFTPRPSRLGIEQGMLGASTMRSVGDRMKNWIPWIHRPIPVTNKRPSIGYSIDGDRNSVGRRSRNNTSSTSTSKAVRGKYETISEDDNEEVDAIGTGRTRPGERTRMDTMVTDEDRAAVADSVIVIGDGDFTLESGSSNHHSQQNRSGPSAAPFRGRTETYNTKSSSINVDVNVEPPSPTVESTQLHSSSFLPSRGAPPLMPPAPLERPPLPPVITRNTPRRTPSPHLRISTQFDDNPISLSNSNLSNARHENPSIQINATSELLHPLVSRISPTSSQQGLSGQHQQGSSSSNPGTNALSYVTLPGISGSNLTTLAGHDITTSSRRHSGSGPRPLPQPADVTLPELTHQKSDSSMGRYSILRAPNDTAADKPGMSTGGHTRWPSQQSDFDPYKDSGVPFPARLEPNRPPGMQHSHPYTHHHERSTSSTSLPRAPGDPVGQHQRGWSADDDADRASLLERRPMKVDDGMSGSRGVYIATPRDVATLGALPKHYRAFSSESFATATSDYGSGSWNDGVGKSSENHRLSGSRSASGLSPISPTLRSLEADPRNNAGFATYGGHESISGGSGWDASTSSHDNDSLIEPPPPFVGRSPNLSPPSLMDFSPNLAANRTLSPNVSPRPGHARLGSESSSLKPSRSREDILNPAKNDPVRLFPASVRAAGYTTALSPGSGPTPTPTPSRTPQPPVSRSGNTSANGTRSGHTPNSSSGSQQLVTGTDLLPGYIERERAFPSRGATWGTESSGAHSILIEPVQQLPDIYPHSRNGSGNQRTPY